MRPVELRDDDLEAVAGGKSTSSLIVSDIIGFGGDGVGNNWRDYRDAIRDDRERSLRRRGLLLDD